MTSTQSRSSQEKPLEPVKPEENAAWTGEEPRNQQLTTLAAIALTTTLTIPVTKVTKQEAGTCCPVDQAQRPTADWRAELKARYKAMPKTAWFRAAHEDRSLGDPTKIS